MRSSALHSVLCMLLVIALLAVRTSPAEEQDRSSAADRLEIIKESQNPLTRELGAVILENTVAFGLGSTDEVSYALNIKPRLPIILNKHLSLINRTSLPVLNEPSATGDDLRISGIGDLQHTTLVSPTTGRSVVWGLGPTIGFPTATDDQLGSEKWLLGPAAIFVYAPRRSVFGLVIQNLWSVGGDSDRPEVNKLLLRPLVNINLPREWYITSKPNIYANWNASGEDRWIVEAGGGIGKVFRIGRLGIGLECQFFGLPVRPEGAARWTARFDIKVLFRRGHFAKRLRKDTQADLPSQGIPE